MPPLIRLLEAHKLFTFDIENNKYAPLAQLVLSLPIKANSELRLGVPLAPLD